MDRRAKNVRRFRPWVGAIATVVLGACADMGSLPTDGESSSGSTYDDEIQPIWDRACISCHTGAVTSTQFSLKGEDSYAYLVGVASAQVDSLQRVVPGDPDASYLVMKIEQDPPPKRVRMPKNADPLDPSDIEKIRQWITDGALEEDL